MVSVALNVIKNEVEYCYSCILDPSVESICKLYWVEKAVRPKCQFSFDQLFKGLHYK